MSRLIIFKAKPSSPDKETRTLQPSGVLTDFLGQHFDYSGNPPPAPGYRLPEFKQDDLAATFDHRGGITHRRLSPWCVAKIDEYVGNTGQEEMGEVLLAYCDYAPLSDQENPWVETQPATVSVESFGGDTAAFEKWKSTQVVTV